MRLAIFERPKTTVTLPYIRGLSEEIKRVLSLSEVLHHQQHTTTHCMLESWYI